MGQHHVLLLKDPPHRIGLVRPHGIGEGAAAEEDLCPRVKKPLRVGEGPLDVAIEHLVVSSCDVGGSLSIRPDPLQEGSIDCLRLALHQGGLLWIQHWLVVFVFVEDLHRLPIHHEVDDSYGIEVLGSVFLGAFVPIRAPSLDLPSAVDAQVQDLDIFCPAAQQRGDKCPDMIFADDGRVDPNGDVLRSKRLWKYFAQSRHIS